MKILFIINIPSPYNIDLFYYLQNNLSDYQFHILYISETEDNRQWTTNKEILRNVYVLNTKTFKFHNKLDVHYIHVPINTFSKLNKINPDIIIAWEYNLAALQGFLWCKIHKKKYISATEGTLRNERNLWFLQRFTRKVISAGANAFLVSGIKSKEKLLSWGIKKEKIFTELLTIDIRNFSNIKREPAQDIILYVGSMVKRKGVDLLIESLPYINGSYHLRIVGNGSKEELIYLKNLAQARNVSENISWCGFKTGTDLLEEYKRATVFVLPTREDCFGLVLLEALAARVPIISSKYADGVYDIISNNKNGYIVDPYNSEDLGKKIETIINNPILWSQWEKYDADIIHKFSYNEVSKGFIQAIEYVK